MSAAQFLAPVSPLPEFDPKEAAVSAVMGPPARAGGVSFGQMLSQGLEQVNGALLDSQVDMQRIASGDVSNLHQVMIRMEESRLAFQWMLQVRNRLVSAYSEIMNMQV